MACKCICVISVISGFYSSFIAIVMLICNKCFNELSKIGFSYKRINDLLKLLFPKLHTMGPKVSIQCKNSKL